MSALERCRIEDMLLPSIFWLFKNRNLRVSWGGNGELFIGAHLIATAADVADGSWQVKYPAVIRTLGLV